MAENGFNDDTLIYHREAEMFVSSHADRSNSFDKRSAHFLSPTIPHSSSSPDLPNISLCRRGFTLRELRSMFRFRDYFLGDNRWKSWARKLHDEHELTWKKAGIYEAIGSSAYETLTDPDVIIAVAEKWCSDTNTFMFPWGEATVTLEDVNVLGGFGLLGESIFDSPESLNNFGCERVLFQAFHDICYENCRVPDTQQWMERFECHQFEHEAFIALWLSKFVFPTQMYDAVNKHVIPVAIRLAVGHRVALAPPVLASIYRGLTSMKRRIMKMPKYRILDIYEPLYLVQLWVWERFLQLQPQPNVLNRHDVPRIALWKNVKRGERKQNIRLALDTAGQSFLWRPYMLPCNGWFVHPLFKDEEQWISMASVSCHVGRDIEAFARCLRVSDLVGFGGFVQQYHPHRVAMQFGFDQDVPKYIPTQNQAHEITWWYYSRPLMNTLIIYIPSRISEPSVTKKYFNWWAKSVLPQLDLFRGVARQPRSLRKHRRRKEDEEEIDSIDLDNLTLKQVMIYKEQRSKKARMMQGEFEAMFMNRYSLEKATRGVNEGIVYRKGEAAASNQDDYQARNIELEAENRQLVGKVTELQKMIDFLRSGFVLGKGINREEAA
ncbi:hypothetical protein QQ045_000643 [Rhodiola kirilowii]